MDVRFLIDVHIDHAIAAALKPLGHDVLTLGRWSKLPDHVQQAILTLLEAAQQTQQLGPDRW